MVAVEYYGKEVKKPLFQVEKNITADQTEVLSLNLNDQSTSDSMSLS